MKMPQDEATRVVGVYAYLEPGKVFRYQSGCVVAGSESMIRNYIASTLRESSRNMRIAKLRFQELLDGLNGGAEYAFDKASYARFYALARRAGIDDLEGFPESADGGVTFMKVSFRPDAGDRPSRR